MRARRDQVQAYRFVTRRLVSAMLSGDPEAAEVPLRRLFMAGVAGVMAAAVVLAGVGIWGLLRPGGNRAWRQESTLVIERDSGARYVYAEGVLYPVLNYASARLIVGADSPRQESVSAASLVGTPRGVPLGIPGAPDALPDPERMLSLQWTVCSVPGPVGPVVRVLVGDPLSGGEDLGGQGVLVTAGSELYLLTASRRFRIPDKTALIALDLVGTDPVPVGRSLIEAVTSGPDLAAPPIPGAGGAGRPVGGRPAQIGEVFRSGGKHYVTLRTGLVPVGEVTARLLTADGRRPIEVPAAEVAAVLAEEQVEPPGMPGAIPSLRPVDGGRAAVCAPYRGDVDEPTRVEVYPRIPAPVAASTRGVTEERHWEAGADRVLVPGGRGAVVQASPGPGVPATGTVYLLTDQGCKFALVDEARVALGYGNTPAMPVPAALLALVPTGPTLDPAAARRPATIPAPARGSVSHGV